MKNIKKAMVLLWMIVFLGMAGKTANAQQMNISISDGQNLTYDMKVGDLGQITPVDGSGLSLSYEIQGIDSWRYDYEDVVHVNENGNYECVGKGDVKIIVRTKNYEYDENDFYATITIHAVYDMTYVTLQKTEITSYLVPYYISPDKKMTPSYNGCTEYIGVNGIGKYADNMDISIKSSSSKVSVDAEIENISEDEANPQYAIVLEMYARKKASTKITITIEDKVFVVPVTIVPVKISNNSMLLGKSKKQTLKVNNYPGNVKWMTTNSKVATVSANGVVKGKKYGNCIVYANINGNCMGCAVSVVPKKLIKVCEHAEYIGKNWTYSQELRAKTGYYDCSALVWKAYSKAGMYFGNRSYPGTTVTESRWCKKHKRLLKGGYKLNMVSKMQLMPGDLVFKSNARKGVDKMIDSTTHVEMFTGYVCTSVDSNGNASFVEKWGARGSGYAYSFPKGSMVGRPIKYTPVK